MEAEDLKKKYVNVVLPVPVKRVFTYRVPPEMAELVNPGCRVKVKFGRRGLTGYILSFCGKPRGNFRIRELSALVDKTPLINEELLDLAGWMADYYLHPIGEILKVMLPAGITGKQRFSPEEISQRSFPREINSPKLNDEQEKAFEVVTEGMKEGKHLSVMLHGVTGSGKTEVYMRCIEEAFNYGKRAILLIPEIALIPQITVRFKRRFGDRVAVLHSRLTGAQRYAIWKKASTGELDIVIGPRSAVFVPMKDLGIFVVDEEQDASYKQQEKPHYNAVDVAFYRARNENAVLLMGSATPSLPRYFQFKNSGDYYFQLRTRPTGGEMPPVEIVDMRGSRQVFSDKLLDLIAKSHAAGEQSILLLNRRGHANFVQCRKCGWIDTCPNCSISLTYHTRGAGLICHYCGYRDDYPEKCPACGSYKISHAGVGTQRVEVELSNIMPGLRIARMDFDTTSKRDGHSEILERFARGDADLLLGTQMVAKGHHYPNVTTVGILSADSGLNFPDFMAAERTFQLLSQAAGRTGRGEKGGGVLVQTYAPEHYLFNYLIDHDFDGFAETELSLRRELNYPPETDLLLFTVMSTSEDRARTASDKIYETLSDLDLERELSFLGPTPARIARLRGKYRYHILIKGTFDSKSKRILIDTAVKGVSNFKKTEIRWDVDPVTFF
ncbi:MAG: primosomal protein N' [Candidatus Krumholzibacteriota bacterium]|nr:primosomal protein N' [Candidatus Krumholzibacteriota bacterium]